MGNLDSLDPFTAVYEIYLSELKVYKQGLLELLMNTIISQHGNEIYHCSYYAKEVINIKFPSDITLALSALNEKIF